MDSLRYWVTRVPCRRLPLRSRRDAGARGRTASIPAPASSMRCARIRCCRSVKLISEPWDLGPGGYQLGHHPPGFAEWNDRFRDSVRRFWRGDAGQRADFAARLAGSADLFGQRGAPPWASVNFAACARRLHAARRRELRERHNEANGEDNRDGTTTTTQRNWGVEGPTDDPEIIDTARARAARACSPRCCCRRARRCCLPATNSGARSAATTMPTARTTRSRGSTGRRHLGRRRKRSPTSSPADPLRHAHPVLRCAALPARQEEPAPGILDIPWFDQQGEMIKRIVEQRREAPLVAARRAARNDGSSVAILTCSSIRRQKTSFQLPTHDCRRGCLIDSSAPDKAESDITTRRSRFWRAALC